MKKSEILLSTKMSQDMSLKVMVYGCKIIVKLTDVRPTFSFFLLKFPPRPWAESSDFLFPGTMRIIVAFSYKSLLRSFIRANQFR